MKKTMFITSVIMVVVLAIALTTSSLAWFAAGGNTTVSVSEFVVQAKSNSAANGLEISRAQSANYSTSAISLYDGNEATDGIARTGFIPMVPLGELTANNNEYDGNDLLTLLLTSMKTAQTHVVEGVEKFVTAPQDASVPFNRDFYIRNTGDGSTSASVTTTLTVDLHSANVTYGAQLNVAVFDVTNYDSTNHTGAVLIAFAGNGIQNAAQNSDAANAATVFCQPSAAWAAEANVATYNALTKTFDSFPCGTLTLEPAENNGEGGLTYHPHTIKVIAWFDGASLDNLNSNTDVEITIEFNI